MSLAARPKTWTYLGASPTVYVVVVTHGQAEGPAFEHPDFTEDMLADWDPVSSAFDDILAERSGNGSELPRVVLRAFAEKADAEFYADMASACFEGEYRVQGLTLGALLGEKAWKPDGECRGTIELSEICPEGVNVVETLWSSEGLAS